MSSPSLIGGATGLESIVDLWTKHYHVILNSVRSDLCNIGDVSLDAGVSITLDKVLYVFGEIGNG